MGRTKKIPKKEQFKILEQENAVLEKKNKKYVTEIQRAQGILRNQIFKLAKHDTCNLASAAHKNLRPENLPEFLECEVFIQQASKQLHNYHHAIQRVGTDRTTLSTAAISHPADTSDALLEKFPETTSFLADIPHLADTSDARLEKFPGTTPFVADIPHLADKSDALLEKFPGTTSFVADIPDLASTSDALVEECPGTTSSAADMPKTSDTLPEELCPYTMNLNHDASDIEMLEDIRSLPDTASPIVLGFNKNVKEFHSQSYTLSSETLENKEAFCANTGESNNQSFAGVKDVPGDLNIFEKEPDFLNDLSVKSKQPPSFDPEVPNLETLLEIQNKTYFTRAEKGKPYSTLLPLQQQETSLQDLNVHLDHPSPFHSPPFKKDQKTCSGGLSSPSPALNINIAVQGTNICNEDKDESSVKVVNNNKIHSACNTSWNNSKGGVNVEQDIKSFTDILDFKMGSSKFGGKEDDPSYLDDAEEDDLDVLLLDLQQAKKDLNLKEEMHHLYVHMAPSPESDLLPSLMLTFKANQPGRYIEGYDRHAFESKETFSENLSNTLEEERENFSIPSFQDFIAF